MPCIICSIIIMGFCCMTGAIIGWPIIWPGIICPIWPGIICPGIICPFIMGCPIWPIWPGICPPIIWPFIMG